MTLASLRIRTPPCNSRQIWPVLLLSLVLGLGTGLRGAEAGWRAGFARAVITPQQPVMMGGYANRDKPSRGVVNDLYVKAMALIDGTGHRSVLITCDFIGFRSGMADPICERIMKASGLARSQILLNSSHTHTGPGPRLAAPSGNPKNEAEQATFDYSVWLQDRVVETALAALADTQPATLSHAVGAVKFPFNRRQYTERGVILGVNPSGPNDRSVPVLRVTAADGKILGVVFGAACHNTTIPPLDYQICGDFAGFAQEQLEQKHPGATAMFMQGCGGDSTPYPTGSLALARAHGAELGSEVERVLAKGSLQPVLGPLHTGLAYAELPLEPPPSLAEIEQMAREPALWKKAAAAQMLLQHHAGKKPPTHYRAPFALWKFGQGLTMVGLSGETVADYVTMAQRVFGPVNLWVAGYCNDIYGYLPNTRILQEGGYEARGLYEGRRFAPGVEFTVEATLAGLQKAAPVPPPR